MSITCEDLMGLKHFQSIKLLAGHSGIHRTVTWPYVVITPSVEEWLNSGEILFIINSNEQNMSNWEFLKRIIIDCSSKRISGIVLVGSVSGLDSIPQNVLKLSDDYATPLYAMPWDLKLINVTKEIIDLIVSDKNIQKKERFLLNACCFQKGIPQIHFKTMPYCTPFLLKACILFSALWSPRQSFQKVMPLFLKQ